MDVRVHERVVCSILCWKVDAVMLRLWFLVKGAAACKSETLTAAKAEREHSG